MQYALAFYLIGSYVSLDPRIPALHIIPPGCRVVFLFCNAIINSSRSGILAEFISCDCYISTKFDYYGFHGLNLEFSTYPHAHYDWLMLNVIDLAPTNTSMSLTMGGCWILSKCTRTRFASSSSE